LDVGHHGVDKRLQLVRRGGCCCSSLPRPESREPQKLRVKLTLHIRSKVRDPKNPLRFRSHHVLWLHPPKHPTWKGWRRVEPKSQQSRRTLKLPEELLPILRSHRTTQLESRLAAGGRWKDQGFVFTSRYGEPLDGPRLNRQTKELLRQTWAGGSPECEHLQVIDRKCVDWGAAHLPVLHFHSLRHSCASFLLAQGVPARVVMEILGHSDIRLTLNTYSHVSQELQEAAARQMSAVLWSEAKA
jgi:integrase